MSLEYYKKQMVDLRARLQKEKDAKKKDNEYYARCIKGQQRQQAKPVIASQKLTTLPPTTGR